MSRVVDQVKGFFTIEGPLDPGRRNAIRILGVFSAAGVLAACAGEEEGKKEAVTVEITGTNLFCASTDNSVINTSSSCGPNDKILHPGDNCVLTEPGLLSSELNCGGAQVRIPNNRFKKVNN